MKINVYRVLMPVYWRGRTYATNERIRLTELQAEEFVADDRIELVAEFVPLNGSQWAAPVTR